MRRLLTTTAIVVGALYFFGTPAKASNTIGSIINVTGYETPNGAAFGAALTDGYSYYTGQITLDLDDGTKITVFCADLNHTLHAGQYQFGLLTEDGQGHPITEALSNLLGHIAAFGLSHDDDNAIAAQAAIWDKEYTILTSFFLNSTDHINAQTDYTALINGLGTFSNDGEYAVALIPYGQGWFGDTTASQQMIVGTFAFAPEPASLALFSVGLLGLGFVTAKRRN
jgi:hypothetical protein